MLYSFYSLSGRTVWASLNQFLILPTLLNLYLKYLCQTISLNRVRLYQHLGHSFCYQVSPGNVTNQTRVLGQMTNLMGLNVLPYYIIFKIPLNTRNWLAPSPWQFYMQNIKPLQNCKVEDEVQKSAIMSRDRNTFVNQSICLKINLFNSSPKKGTHKTKIGMQARMLSVKVLFLIYIYKQF